MVNTLYVKTASDTVWREVPISRSTIDELREKLADKFCYRSENLLEILMLIEEEDGSTRTMVIDADDQVGAMRHFARLEVLFKGKPDPALRIFARHIAKLKQQAAPGAKVDLKQLQNVKQLGASGNK